MKQNFDELFSRMKPEAQERVKARSGELLQEMALADLRRAQASTQQKLAKTLGVNQAWISRVERQTDMYLSTLRSYIEALGGELEVSARFENSFVHLNQFAKIGGQAAGEDFQTLPIDGNAASSDAMIEPVIPRAEVDNPSKATTVAAALLLFQLLPHRALPDLMQLYGGGTYSNGVHFFGMRCSSELDPARHHNVDQRTTTPTPSLTIVDTIASLPLQKVDAWFEHKEDNRVTAAA